MRLIMQNSRSLKEAFDCVSLSIVEDSQFESAVIIQLSKVTISILQAAFGLAQFRRVVSNKVEGVEDEGISLQRVSFRVC